MLIKRVSDWHTGALANPFEELERMRKIMDWVTGGLSREPFKEPTAGVFPLMNVTEGRDNYYVRAELPGLRAGDLDLSVTGDTLSISGERMLDEEDEKAQYHRRERDSGKFSRIVSLPTRIDVARVEAHCADGVLTVVLPKAEEAKPKQITVKTS